MKQVEVFKTNVQEKEDAQMIVQMLEHHLPAHRINFDLYDCDKILRVEGEAITIPQIILLVEDNGFTCQVLE